MSVRRGKGITLVALLALIAGANSFAADTQVQSDCPQVKLKDGTTGADPACVKSIQNAVQQCNANSGKRADCAAMCSVFLKTDNIGSSQQAANINNCFSNGPAVSGDQGAATGGWPDLMKQAVAARGDIEGANADVTSKKNQALREKDITKLNCVEDKLQQIRGLMSLASQAIINLAKAPDRDAAAHEIKRLQIVQEKVQTLRVEANACVGNEASYVGDTTVGLEIDPNIPKDDPTEPALPLPDVTRPPEASPFI